MPRLNTSSTFLLLVAIAMVAGTNMAHAICKKMAHIHFYMHGQVSGLNPSMVQVVAGPITIPDVPPRIRFGDIYVFDDLLTAGRSPDSLPVGRGQGLYSVSALDKPRYLFVMNVVLTAGKYNGSTIAVQGPNYILASVRELSVIGGSGKFRMARGYVIWKTVWFNTTTGDVLLELDIYASTCEAEGWLITESTFTGYADE